MKKDLTTTSYKALIWITPIFCISILPGIIRFALNLVNNFDYDFRFLSYPLSVFFSPFLFNLITGLSICFLVIGIKKNINQITFWGCLIGLVYTLVAIVIYFVAFLGFNIPFMDFVYPLFVKYGISQPSLILCVYCFLFFFINTNKLNFPSVID